MTEETNQSLGPQTQQHSTEAVAQVQHTENVGESATSEAQQENKEARRPINEPVVPEDHNWRKARDIMKAQHAEISNLKKEITDMKPRPTDEFEGIDKDDYVTFEQAQRLAERKAEKRAHEIASKIVDERLQAVEGERLEEKARSRFQDYDYVVDNFAIPMVEKNPALAKAIKSSPNWPEMAYRFAKSSPEYEAYLSKRQQKNDAPAAERVIKNQERPLASSAAGSSLKSQAENFASMSPEDIWKKSREYSRHAS